MMKTAKGILAIALFAAACVPGFPASIDFGGGILNSTGLGNYPSMTTPGAAPALIQRDAGNLWLQAVLADGLTLNAQAGALFAMDAYSSRPMFYYVDADALSLEGSVKASQDGGFLFRYAVGRMALSDFTGYVLNHKADGVSLGFEIPALSADVSAGYTGLIIKGASSIAVSWADVNDAANPAVWFAPPRLVETARVVFLDVLGQRITVSGVFQQDLRDTVLDLATSGTTDLIAAGTTILSPGRGGAVSSEYFGLGLDGTIVSTLSYSLYGYLGLVHDLTYTAGAYANDMGVSALAGAGLSYFAPGALYSRMGVKLVFASGDAGATSLYESNTQDFTLFMPVSSAALGYVYSPRLSNIVRLEASYSLKPLSGVSPTLGKNLDAGVKAAVYVRPTLGAVSDLDIAVSGTEMYLGTETDLTVNFRPLSDLGLTLWGGLFIPGSAFGASPALQYRAGLDVSLSF